MVSRELLSAALAVGAGLTALALPPVTASVHRITLLSLLFLEVSLLLLTHGSTYLGLTYLIVYVGAISLLFVFTVMMVHGDLGS